MDGRSKWKKETEWVQAHRGMWVEAFEFWRVAALFAWEGGNTGFQEKAREQGMVVEKQQLV